jgi:L-ascorbate metabolism protein UlaG (beta-lactamase superfamily)
MIKPALQDDALLSDIHSACRDDGRIRLWWLGQSGFLLQWNAQHLLMDPYLSDSLTAKYAGTDKPHVRMTERAIDPALLDFIDVVTSSHAHTDHLDGETLNAVFQASPRCSLVIPEACRNVVNARVPAMAVQAIGLDDGQSTTVGEFAITAVASAHEEVDRDALERCRYLGYVIRCGPWTIYHSGDTVFYERMVSKLAIHSIDIALLPINGRLPGRGVPGNLDAIEAVRLARQIRARIVIPCHYEMFEFNTVRPDEFVRQARQMAQPYKVLRCGERWEGPDLTGFLY